MYAQITHENALARHPNEVKIALLKHKLTDPALVEWGYDAGVAIDGSYNLAQDAKGVDRFILSADSHIITLAAQVGRKTVHVDLDPVAMAQKWETLPHEIYGIEDRPAGHGLWLWDDKQVFSPGWNECVVVGGITDGKTTVLRMARDISWPHRAELLRKVEGKTGWGGTMTDASGHLHGLGDKLAKTAGQWAHTGQLSGSSKTAQASIDNGKLRHLTDDEVDTIVHSFHSRHITGTSAEDELAEQLGLRPIGAGTTGPSTPSMWADRIAKGRKWNWGQRVEAADLAQYESLKKNTAPSSGNAMKVFSALLNPENQRKKVQATEMIKHIAMGVSADQAHALATGQSIDQAKPRKAKL